MVLAAPDNCGDWSEHEEFLGVFERAEALFEKISATGERSRGPLQVVFTPSNADQTDLPAWPLDVDPSAVIRDLETGEWGDYTDPAVGIVFEAGSRAERLRASLVQDGTDYAFDGATQGKVHVLARDVAPPQVAALLTELDLRARADAEKLGKECDSPVDCGASIQCQERANGDTACNTCILPNDDEWRCQNNDDCCAGLVCCVDCGEKSGTCIAEPDPCSTCLGNGGRWVNFDRCESECIPDTDCFTNECPGTCAEDNCGGCATPDNCWAAGCEWQTADFGGGCFSTSVIEEPSASACEVFAESEDLPGVTIHLEGDSCTFVSGQGGAFHYTVDLAESLDFTAPSSNGACGLCYEASAPETWIDFRIEGDGGQYCPECNIGCCPPNEEIESTLVAPHRSEALLQWPGLQWSGPSDTNEMPMGAFPPGSYEVRVTLSVPGVGEVTAVLPIEVTAAQ